MTAATHGSDARAQRTIRPPGGEKTLEWITALAAAGIDYRLDRAGARWLIHVPSARWPGALAEIRAYEVINRGWPPAATSGGARPREEGPGWSSLLVVIGLCAAYAALGPYSGDDPLLRAAAADSARIRAGEWWRAVTALMLHSDGLHLAGNAMLLFFLGRAATGVLGAGVAWLVILAAGVAGNAAAATAAPVWPAHVSVGASTSVFGALGLLAGCQFLGRLRPLGSLRSVWSRAWIPVMAALALLGLLGTGPRSDLAAHALGFLFGVGLAVPAWALAGLAPGWRAQLVLLGGAAAAIAAAWACALRAS